MTPPIAIYGYTDPEPPQLHYSQNVLCIATSTLCKSTSFVEVIGVFIVVVPDVLVVVTVLGFVVVVLEVVVVVTRLPTSSFSKSVCLKSSRIACNACVVETIAYLY